LSSSRSELDVSSGRAPLSASAWRTFLRNVSGCIPRSAAMCAIGRSLSNAKRTPRAISSSGYFFDRAMGSENLLPPGQHPGIEVSVKPGLAHSAIWGASPGLIA
jgi:hypothetical protein